MGDRVMLMVAYDTLRSDKPVAAALNFLGSTTIYGRNWGCLVGDRYKNLHFELCYYQAIEAAIELGLSRVEAGAQVRTSTHIAKPINGFQCQLINIKLHTDDQPVNVWRIVLCIWIYMSEWNL
jgi:predicted N-acyltransferase